MKWHTGPHHRVPRCPRRVKSERGQISVGTYTRTTLHPTRSPLMRRLRHVSSSLGSTERVGLPTYCQPVCHKLSAWLGRSSSLPGCMGLPGSSIALMLPSDPTPPGLSTFQLITFGAADAVLDTDAAPKICCNPINFGARGVCHILERDGSLPCRSNIATRWISPSRTCRWSASI